MMDVDEGSIETAEMKKQRMNEAVVNQSKFLHSEHKQSMEEEKGQPAKEEEQKEKRMTMLDKCKATGRIGALISCLHFEESKGEIRQYDTERLEIEALSSQTSIRANTAVFKGRYYYEVRLMTPGSMQIGWCSLVSPFSEYQKLGDDPLSYAYDGSAMKKSNNSKSTLYGKKWQAGDVIGSLIDFEMKQISFFRNDENLGVAFRDIKVGPNFAYFPAISLKQGQRVVCNFGATNPFRYRQPYDVCSVQEPTCHVKSYYSCAFYLIDLLKRYVMSTNQEFKSMNLDLKLMVGSIIWEYLYPLLADDPFLMEDQLVQFLFESQNIQIPGLIEIILDSMEIHFSNEQMLKWTATFMSIVSRKTSNISITYADTLQKREFELALLRFTVSLLKREGFLYAWLRSPSFERDLENLFNLNLPTEQDLSPLVKDVYHELVPFSEKNKLAFN